MIAPPNIKFWIDSVVNSYTQIFFSKNKIFGTLLIATTFLDVDLGISGLAAVLMSNLIAITLGFKGRYVREGSYGYNGLLVGLGIGLFYEHNIAFYVVLAVAILITVLFTIAISGVLAKYGLPYLSLPFLLGIWTVLLASRTFESLGLSHRGVYILNELYSSGDIWLVNVYHWFNGLNIPNVIVIYLRSLGAILFQFNALSGLIIAIGLLIHSRIAFSISLLNLIVAYYFYIFIGADIDMLGYSYIGFNFILSGIAIGSFFLIPTKVSYLWSFALVPAIVIVTASISSLFTIAQLSIYSLPFNVIVITFLYVLKLRYNPDALPQETGIQLNSPEENLYENVSRAARFSGAGDVPICLPFFGEWSVSQDQVGRYTHKEEWKDAWDFVIIDEKGEQYKNTGDYKEDYYCYDKPILAPADGEIENVLTGVKDNQIGDANLLQNWGNSVVIKHRYQLYSQLSHLKDGSVTVKKGDGVRKGDVIGHCGNSGRSPYPHLHFQIQRSPYVGSKTHKYPLSTYMVKEDDALSFRLYDYPVEKSIVKAVETQKLLLSAFHFLPGRKLSFKVKEGDIERTDVWETRIDVFNNAYLYCLNTNSRAYFRNDGTMHYFTLFSGQRDSLLYYFFLATYKVLLGYYENLRLREEYPLHLVCRTGLRYLHDFTAPFFRYMKACYSIEYVAIDDEISPSRIELMSYAKLKLFNKTRKEMRFSITIEESLFYSFKIEVNNRTIDAKRIES